MTDWEKKFGLAWAFIQNLNDQTSDFDKICDCTQEEGYHDDRCMTSKARKDYDEIIT